MMNNDRIKMGKIKIDNVFRHLKNNGLKITCRKIIERPRKRAAYQKWIENRENTSNDYQPGMFDIEPLISIAVPVYNVEEKLLRECIDSVLAQSYPNWELCLADDHSTAEHIKPLLKEYTALDPRIKAVFREKNGHICEATDSAIALANGEFIALLDNDDTLAPWALLRVVEYMNQYPDADFFYSDEDKIDTDGKRIDPFFKPDFSPITFLGQNYICHFSVIRKAIIEKVGGFEKGLEGAQDFDLFLKCAEQTDRIIHIPEILYHWRSTAGSTAGNLNAKDYARDAGQRALENALARRGICGMVTGGRVKGTYITHFDVQDEPLVSVIILLKDDADALAKRLDAFRRTAGYDRYEFIIIDRGGNADINFGSIENITLLQLPETFNDAQLYNQAANAAKGNVLLFLNEHIEMQTSDWLAIMLGYAQQSCVGAVGALQTTSDRRIHHAGYILNSKTVAVHSHHDVYCGDVGYFNRLCIAANYAAVSWACMMVRAELFDQVGGFETQLQSAYQDVDFGLKLHAAGLNNVCLSQIEALHHRPKIYHRIAPADRVLMLAKWNAIIHNDPFYNKNLRSEFKVDSSL